MTTKMYQFGEIWDHVAASAISSDDVVVMANRVGIAVTDIASGATGGVLVKGVVKVTKVAGEAWAQGDLVGYDASASGFDKTFTATTGDVENCGSVARAAGSADTVGYIELIVGTAG